MTRVLHFSDIHVEASFRGVPLKQFLNKRLMGYANLRLRRRACHGAAPEKMRALESFMREHDVDVVVCTGDYTALGTEPELELARHVVQPFTQAPLGFVTVPGNHDVYLWDSVHERRFERHFGDVIGTDMPELCTDGSWPQIRLPAEGLAVIAVNSARPNPEPWLSSGRIPDAQIDGLARALRHPRIKDRFVIVATHYAPLLPDGNLDHDRHGLDNADALLETCALMEHGILVHGHVHHRYHVPLPSEGARQFSAGSATHRGREGIWLYEVHPDGEATATPGGWQNQRYVLEPESRVSLTRRGSTARP